MENIKDKLEKEDIEYDEIYRKKWAVRKNISSFFIKNSQKNKII